MDDRNYYNYPIIGFNFPGRKVSFLEKIKNGFSKIGSKIKHLYYGNNGTQYVSDYYNFKPLNQDNIFSFENMLSGDTYAPLNEYNGYIKDPLKDYLKDIPDFQNLEEKSTKEDDVLNSKHSILGESSENQEVNDLIYPEDNIKGNDSEKEISFQIEKVENIGLNVKEDILKLFNPNQKENNNLEINDSGIKSSLFKVPFKENIKSEDDKSKINYKEMNLLNKKRIRFPVFYTEGKPDYSKYKDGIPSFDFNPPHINTIKEIEESREKENNQNKTEIEETKKTFCKKEENIIERNRNTRQDLINKFKRNKSKMKENAFNFK